MRLKELAWFVVIGASNTALTYAVYLLALQFTSYLVAYTISFLFGVIYTALLNIRLAFSSRLRPAVILSHMGCGTVYFLLNLFLLRVAVGHFAVPAALAPLPVLVITFPLYFLAVRAVVARLGSVVTQAGNG
jgi:putative flippase GtrA